MRTAEKNTEHPVHALGPGSALLLAKGMAGGYNEEKSSSRYVRGCGFFSGGISFKGAGI